MQNLRSPVRFEVDEGNKAIVLEHHSVGFRRDETNVDLPCARHRGDPALNPALRTLNRVV